MNLETSLVNQLVTLKSKFDSLLEREKGKHAQEMDNLKSTMKLEKSQINNRYVSQIALLE